MFGWVVIWIYSHWDYSYERWGDEKILSKFVSLPFATYDLALEYKKYIESKKKSLYPHELDSVVIDRITLTEDSYITDGETVWQQPPPSVLEIL
jgi:hypothetical protein